MASSTIAILKPENNPHSNNASQLLAVRLPNIKLPRFSGIYEYWLKFRTVYMDLININTALSRHLNFITSLLVSTMARLSK